MRKLHLIRPNLPSKSNAPQDYKFAVVVCNNDMSLCQTCHINIDQTDLMIMKKSQKTKYDEKDQPLYMGYHCDCFFMSYTLQRASELHGYSLLSKFHRQYIAKKVTKQLLNNSGGSDDKIQSALPKDLKIGYTSDVNYYCDQCNLNIDLGQLQLTGMCKNYPVNYHPRCFAKSFGSVPIILMGVEKLATADRAKIGFLLNIIGFDKRRANASFIESQTTDITTLMKMGKHTSGTSFEWPAPPDEKKAAPQTSEASPQSDALNKLSASHQKASATWHHQPYDPKIAINNLKNIQNHKTVQNVAKVVKHNSCTVPASPSELVTSELVTESTNSGSKVSVPSRKRKTSATFRPNIKPSVSRHHNSSSESRTVNYSSKSSQKAHKIELKKSTIRSEITKILNKYNHDYITSKIVRTMLMESFGCDLTPHKRFIDDTIMELLDIIDNNPVNLKSIPGRIFVEDEGLAPRRASSDKITSKYPPPPSTKDPPHTSNNSIPQSPVTPALDDSDISPFFIMSNNADDIAASNVDNTIDTVQSAHAWGDKSESPKENASNHHETCENENPDESTDNGVEQNGSVLDKGEPIDLRRCCLCCFRIQSLEELPSLYRHIQSQHLTNKSCVLCNIAFKDCYRLMLHVAEFHRSKESFTCKNCDKVFQYHTELHKHVDMCMMDLFSDISDSDDGMSTAQHRRKSRKNPEKYTFDSSSDSDGGTSTLQPSNKKYKLGDSSIPELVSTLNKTQNTLNKINEFIAESTAFNSDDSL